jgi:DNA-binding LacI/PurR family transcriptional regulator
MPVATLTPAQTASPQRKNGIPRYTHLANELRGKIEQGTLQPGDSLPSFREMYSNHGATPTTMNRVYSLLEQEGYIVREPGRGTFVANRQLQTANGTIAFLWSSDLSGLAVPYWAHLIAGIQQAAVRTGSHVLIVDANDAAAAREKVDGVVTNGQVPPPLRHLPSVLLINPREDVPTVLANDHAGTKAATEHLLKLGHRRIAYLAETFEDTQGKRRLAGYQAALLEAGIEPRSSWLRTFDPTQYPNNFDVLGYRTMQAWLQDDWKQLGCTALLAWNDDTAIGVIRALREAELRVPEDVSVAGFDGTKVGAYFTPRLTTIEVPLQEIGARSVELLQQLIAARQGRAAQPESVILPVKLRVGDSTGPVPE